MYTITRTTRTLAALVLAAAFGAGCGGGDSPAPSTGPGPAKSAAEGAAKPAKEEPVSGVVGSQLVTATAQVTAVDVEKRLVTVRRADGKTVTIRCGEAVRNLPQVKIGDDVTIAYHESLAFEVRKPGEATPGTSAVGVAARAKEGEMPAGAAGQVLQVTATIVAIDQPAMRLTLKGPDGNEVEVKARDPEKLARVAVGDLIEITYTEALAVSVTTASGGK